MRVEAASVVPRLAQGDADEVLKTHTKVLQSNIDIELVPHKCPSYSAFIPKIPKGKLRL